MSAYDTWADGHAQAMVDYHHGTRMDRRRFQSLFCSDEFHQGYNATYNHHVEQVGSPNDPESAEEELVARDADRGVGPAVGEGR